MVRREKINVRSRRALRLRFESVTSTLAGQTATPSEMLRSVLGHLRPAGPVTPTGTNPSRSGASEGRLSAALASADAELISHTRADDPPGADRPGLSAEEIEFFKEHGYLVSSLPANSPQPRPRQLNGGGAGAGEARAHPDGRPAAVRRRVLGHAARALLARRPAQLAGRRLQVGQRRDAGLRCGAFSLCAPYPPT